jgi:hypothetical protein
MQKGAITMEKNWQERLRYEHQELLLKINKLENFYNSPKILAISEKQRDILYIQLQTMNAYAGILQLRIEEIK